MLARVFFLIGLFCSGALVGALKDHLREAPNKSGGSQVEGIDFIYMINLDERPEKFQSCLAQLQPYGITPYRFSAINGWKLSLEEINDVGVVYKPGMATDLMGTCYPLNANGPVHEILSVPGQTYFCHCMARGAIGCDLSHASVLRDALHSRYGTVWIMEDDVSVVRDPRLMSKYIQKLDALVGKDGWDILFTDQDTISNTTGDYVVCLGYARRPNFIPENPGRFAQRVDVSPDFRRIGARYGAYSYIIRRSGMKKILRFLKKYSLFLPFDMEFTLPNDIRLYALREDVLSTKRFAPSDNGSPGYQLRG